MLPEVEAVETAHDVTSAHVREEGAAPGPSDGTRRPPLTLDEIIDWMPDEVLSLRDMVQDRGATNVGMRLGKSVADLVWLGRSEKFGPQVPELLGEVTARLLGDCRDALAGQRELRSNLAFQLSRIVRHTISKLDGGRPLQVEVVAGASGHHEVQFRDSEAVRAVPLRSLHRLYDWGTLPICGSGAARSLLELERVLYVRDAIAGVASSMRRVARSHAYRSLGPDLDVAGWIEASEGLPLELLMRDCVSDSGAACRKAPLFEDILEATDLRVGLPGIKRKRGVRIQVSWVSNLKAFWQKRYLIPYAPTVVFLCPLTLAQSWRWDTDATEIADIADPPGPAALEGQVISQQRCRDEEAAEDIKTLLSEALRHRPTHPLGPSEALPRDLRDRIGRFVLKEGQRCHYLLRSRQEERPTYGSSPEYVRNRLLDRLRGADAPAQE